MEGFNLDAVKKEIDERRSGQLVNEQTTGTGRMGAPRDSKKFLVDLLTSVNNNGVPTPAVQALRQVTEITDQRLGVPTTAGKEAPIVQPNQQGYPQQQYAQQPMNENLMPQQQMPVGDGRGDVFFEQQMQKGMELLRQRGVQNQQPQQLGAALSQSLNEYANAPFMGQPAQGSVVNAGALNEHITKTMNEMTSNPNFGRLVESAYKNMINEMYAKEKIETALVEIVQSDTFKKIMKKTIVDTLLEIQNRNKK